MEYQKERSEGVYILFDSSIFLTLKLSGFLSSLREANSFLMFVVLGRKSQALIVSSYIHSPLEKKNPGCDQQSHLLWQFDSIKCMYLCLAKRAISRWSYIRISNSHSGRTLVFIHVTHPFTSVWLWSLLILCVLENLAKGFSSHFFLGPFSDASK